MELAEQYGGAEQLMEEAMEFVIELRGEEQIQANQKREKA